MKKKLFISLGALMLLGVSASQVMAHSTIYTDDLGRMHFLGKDPGAKTLQKIEDYDNPYTKDVTNVTYTNADVKKQAKETKVNVKKENSVSDNSFIRSKNSESAEDLSKKRFWHIW